MTGISAYIYHEDYLKYQFGPAHPFKPIREKLTLDALRRLGIFDGKAKHYEPPPASDEELLLVHSSEYIQFVEKMCKRGYGYLDLGDTPATKSLYEGSRRVVGGTILGVKLAMDGEVSHAFNPGGGLHHAKEESASGFCVFNDVAIVVRFLQKKYGLKRIAVVDIDGHHGDGTQEILYGEPVLKISSHRAGIFPGTGYVDELGEGAGRGYSVNIPLPRGTYDDAYLYAFKEVVKPLIEAYEPEFIVNQFGVDGHSQDPLVGLALTTKTYEEVAETMHALAHRFSQGRLLILGGGGYNIDDSVRCWSVMFTTVSEALPEASIGDYRRLFDGEQRNENGGIFDRVKGVVEEIKETIFPLHGLGRS